MTLTLNDTGTLWTSDETHHNAGWWPDAAADDGGVWVVSWLPLRRLDRNQAITAMNLAELVTTGRYLNVHGRALLRAWAEELDLADGDVVAAITGQPDHQEPR